MPGGKEKKAPNDSCNGDALALAAVAATGSILGNIALALKNQKNRNLARDLKKQRDHLVNVISQWQGAYNHIRMENERLVAESSMLRSSLAESKHQNDDLEQVVVSLREKNLTLEAELADSSSVGVTDE